MPGTQIRERSAKLARSLPTDTGVLFLAGPAEKGRTDQAELCKSLAEFERKCGTRQTNSLAWDMADGFFGEGGSTLYFGRITGPAPVKAFVNLLDAGAGVSLIARAKSPGTWGNSLNVSVLAGDAAGEFKVRVTHDTDTTIDYTSPSLVDQNAAIEWAKATDHITLELGATALDPAVAGPLSLATGTDDFNNISDATALAALALFKKDYGPGQVAFAGRTTATAHGQLIAHAAANNRVALCDPADTTVKATLIAAAASFRAIVNARFGGMFGPWVELPALLPGARGRAIPASAVVAGVMARNDARGVSPNKPAAGDLGRLQYANVLRGNAAWTEQDYTDLNDASVNMLRERPGGLTIFGMRSGVLKTTDPVNWQFANMRLYMANAAKADNILERFVFREIDGRKLIFKELQGQLSAMLNDYFVSGSLYGDDAEDAYFVDTDSVNTSQTIANGEIHAAIELTMSPMGETVILDIIKRQITG